MRAGRSRSPEEPNAYEGRRKTERTVEERAANVDAYDTSNVRKSGIRTQTESSERWLDLDQERSVRRMELSGAALV